VGKHGLKLNQNYKNKYSATVSKRGMQKIWQKFIKAKETKDLSRTGKPRKLPIRSERIIYRISSTNNQLCVPRVTCELISGCSATISTSTIRRILKKYDIHGYRSIRNSFLTITQRRKRMLWANKHKEWQFSKWKNIVFSDESIFQSYSSHWKHWMLRTANDKGKPIHMHQTMSHAPQIHIYDAFPWMV